MNPTLLQAGWKIYHECLLCFSSRPFALPPPRTAWWSNGEQWNKSTSTPKRRRRGKNTGTPQTKRTACRALCHVAPCFEAMIYRPEPTWLIRYFVSTSRGRCCPFAVLLPRWPIERNRGERDGSEWTGEIMFGDWSRHSIDPTQELVPSLPPLTIRVKTVPSDVLMFAESGKVSKRFLTKFSQRKAPISSR